MNAPSVPENRLFDLVDSLIAGFEDLVTVISLQAENEKTLKAKIELAANEYQNLLAADSSRSVSSLAVPPSQVLKHLRQPLEIEQQSEVLPAVRRAKQVIEVYRRSKMDKLQVNGTKCPVAHGPVDAEDFEHDFTTPGVQGGLECPFAKMSTGLPPGLEGQADPIAAEFHQDKISTRSPTSEQKPSGKCPIRFLDQHSPDEVAKYFENHKHEIPRSHEICVRRYQQNESSARQLDAKYGSLANMIQGLGVKHKAYLPERDRIEERDRRSSSAVEKWAENLSENPAPPAVDEVVASEEEEAPRVPHFERTLREVRVGESPSRPWGISVPADKEPTPSALQSENDVEHLKIQPESSSAEAEGKPVPKPALDQTTDPKKQSPPVDSASTTTKDRPTQIIFNGPVFFGYSADEVINLFQKTNLGSATMTGANTG
ncbi:hypothetical protein PV11_08247 [Exophiala sideris]|uniref:Uncharacterized protein n=1 Tax=Exophiala sideris TaxID=1016849 RepID=A0A0D1YIA8_9EURO|nr:hypothetical protein PV11_08247 [Exophiala sideris]